MQGKRDIFRLWDLRWLRKQKLRCLSNPAPWKIHQATRHGHIWQPKGTVGYRWIPWERRWKKWHWQIRRSRRSRRSRRRTSIDLRIPLWALSTGHGFPSGSAADQASFAAISTWSWRDEGRTTWHYLWGASCKSCGFRMSWVFEFQALEPERSSSLEKGRKNWQTTFPEWNHSQLQRGAWNAAEGATGTPPVELSFGRAPKTLSERHHLSP